LIEAYDIFARASDTGALKIALHPQRAMRLVWGNATSDDFDHLDLIAQWAGTYPNLRVVLAVEHGSAVATTVATVMAGRVDAAIAALGPLHDHDGYLAGPPAMTLAAAAALEHAGVTPARMLIDNFGM